MSTDLSAPVGTSAGTGWPDASDASAGYGLDPRAGDLDQVDHLDEDGELEADDVDELDEDQVHDELDEDGLDDHRPGTARRPSRDSDRGDVRNVSDVRADDVPAPGDVVAMLLDRVEAAEDLDRSDVQDVALLLGGHAARRLARTLNREFAQARRAQPRRTFLAGLLGGTQEALEPAPDSVSVVLLRIESGQRLTAGEHRRLAAAAGSRGGAVALERAIHDAAGPRGRWDR